MLVNTKKMLEDAYKSNYAIPSPDFFDQRLVRDYVEVAEKLNRPCLLAFSEALSKFLPLEDAYMIGKYYGEKAKVPVALHIDHGKTVEFVKKAIDIGFTSVMIDASADSFEENVRKTKEIVEYAHPRGVTVEAEIGHVGSNALNADMETQDESVYTEVDECVKFVELTGVDSIAVSVGTSHGVYTHGTPVLNFERLKELKDAVSIPLVLHGGSSSGDENLRKCAEIGIAKINIFTDIIKNAAKEAKLGNKDNYRDMALDIDKGAKEMLEHYYHVFNCD